MGSYMKGDGAVSAAKNSNDGNCKLDKKKYNIKINRNSNKIVGKFQLFYYEVTRINLIDSCDCIAICT